MDRGANVVYQQNREGSSLAKSIFISYRRADGGAQSITDHLRDRLLQVFGPQAVFKDVFSIPGAVDYRGVLAQTIANSGIMLVIIGRGWLSSSNERGRRLDDPADPVRQEIEAALTRGLPVLPLLIDGAAMPNERELPPTLGLLAYRNAQPLRPGRDFDHDAADIIRTVAGHVPPVTPLTAAQLRAPGQGMSSRSIATLLILLALLVGGGYLGYATFFTNPTLVANPPTLTSPCFGAPSGSNATTVTFDNTANGDDIQWSVASITQAGGADWATVSPSAGTVPAHGTQKVTVTPDTGLCSKIALQNLLITVTYHKSGALTSAQLVLGTVAVSGGPGGGAFPTITVPVP